MHDPIPATGRQLEITHGAARAVVTEVGAALRAFDVDGVPYSETYGADERPPAGAGAVLIPWPNRVADGRWVLEGESQQLALTEPDKHNAIHGLLRHVPWTVTEHGESTVILHAMVPVQPGWPMPLLTSVGYSLDAAGLTVTHTVENLGSRTVPFGMGVHPYPRAGHAATDDCTLRLAASSVLPVDPERLLPARPPRALQGNEQEFRSGRRLGGVVLDTAFGGASPRPDDPRQLVRHSVTDPTGHGIELWADPVFGWVQVFTASEFPGRGRAVAIEPMTCPPDALNSGTDLITLPPGETWTARWGLRPF
ncbi:aldose 1-epimerase [Halopolyspora algeriensis]|uniref:Aldose 1-epimerase n=1 Tax=Halopolyspora algeriensis TaxID=1500506 RepID=A0A368VRJ6_9ACTN|nr:aldose 1-epimerase family protein [Halopolyspora algeriensis]RCW43635.1 aldose 1-epimerase [Halopolyspora algeriensis]TQM47582.1 aldose 1-epimerase [Halopolyspora algeriensis]